MDCSTGESIQVPLTEDELAQREVDRLAYEAFEAERLAEQEAKELAEVFRNPLTFANADGTIENWSGGMTGEELAEKIEQEFEQFKDNFINKLKNETKTES